MESEAWAQFDQKHVWESGMTESLTKSTCGDIFRVRPREGLRDIDFSIQQSPEFLLLLNNWSNGFNIGQLSIRTAYVMASERSKTTPMAWDGENIWQLRQCSAAMV